MTGCARPGCRRPHRARGLCQVHYVECRKAGTLSSGWTAARPVARHVRQLLRRGWTVRGIARTSGVSATAVAMIGHGRRRHVQTWVADALTAVHPVPPDVRREAA